MLLILRILLVFLVIRAVVVLVRGMIEGASTAPKIEPPTGVQLVRDPVCGVYVTPAKALTLQSGAGTAYFCSEECRQAWRKP